MPISEPAPEPTAPPPTPDPAPAPTAASPTSDTADERQGHPLWRSWAIAAAVVAVLAGAAIFLLGGPANGGGTDPVVAAGTDPATSLPAGGDGGGAGFGPGARGTITGIDGGTITVESNSPDGSSGTTTVETTNETAITESVDGSLDDFEVGDTIAAFGGTNDDGTMVASTVSESDGADIGRPLAGGDLPDGFQPPADGELPDGFQPPADGQLPDGFQPPQGGGGPGAQGAPTSGEITAIGDDSLTIESDDGSSVTVSINDDTTFTVTEDRSLDDLAEGDTVVVVGEAGDDDVVTATSVRVGDDLGFGSGGPGGAPGSSSDDGEA